MEIMMSEEDAAIETLNRVMARFPDETDLEFYRRLQATPGLHVCWTDEFLEGLPGPSEAELLARSPISF